MSAQAVANVINQGAPERVTRRKVRPDSPEDIVPVIGVIEGRLHTSSVGYHSFIESSPIHPRGPVQSEFWLGSTVVGPERSIRDGIRRRGGLIVTYGGDIAIFGSAYKGPLHRLGRNFSVGLIGADDEPDVVTPGDLESIKSGIARLLFEVVSPELSGEAPTDYLAVVRQSMRDMAASEARRVSVGT